MSPGRGHDSDPRCHTSRGPSLRTEGGQWGRQGGNGGDEGGGGLGTWEEGRKGVQEAVAVLHRYK